MVKKNEVDSRKSKTFFHLMFPIVILALIPNYINGSVWLGLTLKTLVFIWIYIALKNFIEAAY